MDLRSQLELLRSVLNMINGPTSLCTKRGPCKYCDDVRDLRELIKKLEAGGVTYG